MKKMTQFEIFIKKLLSHIFLLHNTFLFYNYMHVYKNIMKRRSNFNYISKIYLIKNLLKNNLLFLEFTQKNYDVFAI